MNHSETSTTRLSEYISALLPWAHGHQHKAITTFVGQILHQQTGCQAALARGLGNQEAACKRLSRLLHNPRLSPKALCEAVFWQVVSQLPDSGPVRVAVDWTTEGDQHLLVVSLIVGRRALPLYWRAYQSSVLKGRMRRYETALMRRVLSRLQKLVGSRLIVTADRGFADVQLFTLLDELQVEFIIRVKGSTKVCRPHDSADRTAQTAQTAGIGASSTRCALPAIRVVVIWDIGCTARVVRNDYGSP